MVILEEKFWESLPQTIKESFPVRKKGINITTTHTHFIVLCNYIITSIPESNAYELLIQEYDNIHDVVESYQACTRSYQECVTA